MVAELDDDTVATRIGQMPPLVPTGGEANSTLPVPSPGAAMAAKIARMISSRPFGVRKKFLILRRMSQAPRGVAL